jgi:ketosteroid isomerase-like protein
MEELGMQVDEHAAASGQDANRRLMERFWEAAEARDLETLASLVHPEVAMEWPQSGERFQGRENALGALNVQEVKPEPAGEPSLEGCGDVWVARVPLRYGEEVYHYVGIFSLEDGMIRRSTEYFGAPFPPNPARAAFRDAN